MIVPDISILRTVERKLDKEGLEPSKLDVLVTHGHVTLTGSLVNRITHQGVDNVQREKFRHELKRINGVTEVTLHMSDTNSFI